MGEESGVRVRDSGKERRIRGAKKQREEGIVE
jgi:hypothetical protein